MTATAENSTGPYVWPLSKNQVLWRDNDFDADAEERLYRSMRRFWHPVIYTAELADGPQQAELCGTQLVVARMGDEINVFNDLCAHRGAALSLGCVLPSGELQCGYHGWRYDREGNCTVAPQRPDLAGHLRARIQKYNAVERYGMVWVCLDDEPYYPMPEFPQFDDPSYDKIVIPNSDWNCSPPRRVENFTDLSHFAFVHDGYLGDKGRPGVPAHRVWREDNVLRMVLDGPMNEPSGAGKNSSMDQTESANQGDAEIAVVKSYHVWLPLTALLDSYSGNNHYCLFFHPTPISRGKIRNFTIGARNFGSTEKIHDEMVGWNNIVYEQDRPFVESQRPEQLPEDLSAEMYVQNVDSFSLTYRRSLLDLIDDIVPAGGVSNA